MSFFLSRTFLLTLSLSLASFAIVLPGGGHAEGTQVERARALFQQGLTAYEDGRLDEALEHMLQAQRLAPSPALVFNIARVYERMGDANNGIRYFKRYLRQAKPDEAERKRVQARITELEALRRRQKAQVFTVPPTEGAMANEARLFFARGVAMFKRKQYAAAMQAFEAALRFARLPEIHFNMAVAAEKLGERQLAVDNYREYLRARPNAPDRRHIETRMAQLRAQR